SSSLHGMGVCCIHSAAFFREPKNHSTGLNPGSRDILSSSGMSSYMSLPAVGRGAESGSTFDCALSQQGGPWEAIPTVVSDDQTGSDLHRRGQTIDFR